jgi:glycosyltransferase involved in cell wall biosynthesis
LDAGKLHIAENWATGEPPPFSSPRESRPIVIRYSGNLGLAHDTETIGEVMLRLRNRHDVQFVFGGGGARRPALEQFVKQQGISNVQFVSYLDDQAFRRSLSECHVGLVTLRDKCLGTVVPSKTYSFLSAGRAFLYIGPEGGTVTGIAAEGCGWQRSPGDVDGIVALLENLLDDPGLITQAGRRARAVFEERYSVSKGAGHLADVLMASKAR